MLDIAPLLDRPPPVFSVVIPAFNEAEGLAAFHRRLASVMQPLGPWEAIYVNDGSEDATLATLHRACAVTIRISRIVNLSRNFGKEIATTAGLDHARGERRHRDRRRPAGSAGGHPATGRGVAARLRHGLCAAARAAGETWLKRATAALVLPADAARRPGRAAAAIPAISG